MSVQTFLQIVGACFGVIGSLFFAIGVMRQTVDAMADLTGTHFDFNPHMVAALASQKADYLFGGGLIVVAFVLSLLSYPFTQNNMPISQESAGRVPWIAVASTVVLFFILRYIAGLVARRFEVQIRQRLQKKMDEAKKRLIDH